MPYPSTSRKSVRARNQYCFPTRYDVSCLVAIAALAAAFIGIATHVSSANWLTAFDASVSHGFDNLHRHAFITYCMIAISRLHVPLLICLYTAVFCWLMWRARDWRWLLTAACTVFGGMLLNTGIKHVVARHRPVFENPLLWLTTYSFPSGHTLSATVFYGVLTAWLLHREAVAGFSSRARLLTCAGAVVMVLLVALSRIYLGAHYVSDVVGAILLGTAWLIACLALAKLFTNRM